MVFKSVYEFSSYFRYRLETNRAFRTMSETTVDRRQQTSNSNFFHIHRKMYKIYRSHFSFFLICLTEMAVRAGNALRNVIVSFPIHKFSGNSFSSITVVFARAFVMCMNTTHTHKTFSLFHIATVGHLLGEEGRRGDWVARNLSYGSDE